MIPYFFLIALVSADVLYRKLPRFQKDNLKWFVPNEILEECRKQVEYKLGIIMKEIKNEDIKFWYGLDQMDIQFNNDDFEKYQFQLNIVQNRDYQIELIGSFMYNMNRNRYNNIEIESILKTHLKEKETQYQIELNQYKNDIIGQFDIIEPQFNYSKTKVKQDNTNIKLDQLRNKKFKKYDLNQNKKKIVIDQLLSRISHDKRMAILEYDDVECREYKEMKLCYMKVLFQSENHIHSIKVQFIDRGDKIVIMAIDDLTYKSNQNMNG